MKTASTFGHQVRERRLGQRGVRLGDDVVRWHIERHIERLRRVGRVNTIRGLDCRLERIGRDQRDGLSSVQDGRREHRLEALDGVSARKDVPRRLQIGEVLVGKD